MMRQNRFDDLSPDDIAAAATLAEELHRQDVERNSVLAAAEEVGIPQEYLQRAAAQIRAEKARQRQVREKRRNGIVVGVSVLTIIAAVNITAWEQHVVRLPSGSAKHLDLFHAAVAHSKPKIDVNKLPPIQIIPCPQKLTMDVRRFAGRFTTTLTFQNQYAESVNIVQLDDSGDRVHKFAVNPGGTMSVDTPFGAPWLITDSKDRTLGIFFAPASPSRATIPSRDIFDSLRDVAPMDRQYDFFGYLQPLNENMPVPSSHGKPGLQTEIEFVNLRDLPVDLYEVGPDDVRGMVKVLGPGMNYVSDTSTNNSWVVTDDNGGMIARYKPQGNPMPAIIWPE